MNRGLSLKTRIFNTLRSAVIRTPLEGLLRRMVKDKSPNYFFSKLVPNHYQYPKGTKRIIDRNGIKLSVDISDLIGHYLYYGFLDNSQNSLMELVIQGDRIIDIGSNIGATAIQFAKKVGPKGFVLGFEPDPTNFKLCQENIALNDSLSLQILHMGIGEKQAKAHMEINNRFNRGANSISLDSYEQGDKVSIESLDHVMERYKWDKLDLIKIDVEGYELKALKGGVKTIRTFKPVLFIELNNRHLLKYGDSARLLIEYLIDKLGYQKIIHAESGESIDQNNNFENCHFDIIAEK